VLVNAFFFYLCRWVRPCDLYRGWFLSSRVFISIEGYYSLAYTISCGNAKQLRVSEVKDFRRF